MLGRDWSTQHCSGKHPRHPKYYPQQEISHEIVEKKISDLYDQQCIKCFQIGKSKNRLEVSFNVCNTDSYYKYCCEHQHKDAAILAQEYVASLRVEETGSIPGVPKTRSIVLTFDIRKYSIILISSDKTLSSEKNDDKIIWFGDIIHLAVHTINHIFCSVLLSNVFCHFCCFVICIYIGIFVQF